MSYFTEFAQLLKTNELDGRFREIIERLAEILDEQEERIKKLEETCIREK